MANNATVTDIISQDVPKKVAGVTTLEPISQKFEHFNNKLTYKGAITRDFKIFVTATLSAGASQRLGLYITKK